MNKHNIQADILRELKFSILASNTYNGTKSNKSSLQNPPKLSSGSKKVKEKQGPSGKLININIYRKFPNCFIFLSFNILEYYDL